MLRAAAQLAFIIFVGTLIVVFVSTYYANPYASPQSTLQGVLVRTFVATATLFALAMAALGKREQCPACDRWWARTVRTRQGVGRKIEYHVPRPQHTPGLRFRNSGFSEKPRHLITDLFRVEYSCRYCGHGWAALATKDYSG